MSKTHAQVNLIGLIALLAAASAGAARADGPSRRP